VYFYQKFTCEDLLQRLFVLIHAMPRTVIWTGCEMRFDFCRQQITWLHNFGIQYHSTFYSLQIYLPNNATKIIREILDCQNVYYL